MPPKQKAKPVKKAKDESEDEDESEEEKVNTKSKKITKQPKDTKKAAASKKKGKAKDESDEDAGSDSDDAKGKGKKKAAPKKETKAKKDDSKSSSSIKGYTPEQYEKYKEYLKDLESEKNDALKDALKKNDQASTGNKKELIAKVADGKVLGKIPRCPKCDGGRPRFDFKKGTYTCPGYRDDTDYVNCRKKYTVEELKREEWQE